jgi:MSHA biogenesis protein MshM
LISRASEGLTRRINILADKALLAAFSEGVHQVDGRQVRAAIRDAQFQASLPGDGRWLWIGSRCLAIARSPASPTFAGSHMRVGRPAAGAASTPADGHPGAPVV